MKTFMVKYRPERSNEYHIVFVEGTSLHNILKIIIEAGYVIQAVGEATR